MSNQISRRDFTIQSMGSLLTFSPLETLFAHDAFADEIKPITAKWLKDMNELSRDVKGRKLTQIQWQKKTNSYHERIEGYACSCHGVPRFLREELAEIMELHVDIRHTGG